MPTLLNRRERKAAQLLKHYATCERLAIALGTAPSKADGKKISVALFKLEREANRVATCYCNGEVTNYRFPDCTGRFDPNAEDGETSWENFAICTKLAIERVFRGHVPGLLVNGDARGHALKIDPDNNLGALLIADAGLQTDWGGYGILSPDINGN